MTMKDPGHNFPSGQGKLGGCSFYKCLIFALKKGFLLVFWSFDRRKLAISRTVGRRELGGAAFESSPRDAF